MGLYFQIAKLQSIIDKKFTEYGIWNILYAPSLN